MPNLSWRILATGARQFVDVGGVLHQHHLEATRSARGGPEPKELLGLVERGTARSEPELAAPAKVGPKFVEAGLQHWHARSADRCGAVDPRRKGGDEQRGGAVLGDVVGDGGHHLVDREINSKDHAPLLPTRLVDLRSQPAVEERWRQPGGEFGREQETGYSRFADLGNMEVSERNLCPGPGGSSPDTHVQLLPNARGEGERGHRSTEY